MGESCHLRAYPNLMTIKTFQLLHDTGYEWNRRAFSNESIYLMKTPDFSLYTHYSKSKYYYMGRFSLDYGRISFNSRYGLLRTG